ALRAHLVPRHPYVVAVHRDIGMARTGPTDLEYVRGRMAGIKLAVPDRRPVTGLVPHAVQHTARSDGEPRPLVRASGDVPVFEGSALRVGGLAVGAQHGECVVADIVAEHAAEKRRDVAVRL